MSSSRLFRTPMSRGLLSGALAGGLALWFTIAEETIVGFGSLLVFWTVVPFSELLLLIALPAFLAHRNTGRLTSILFNTMLFAAISYSLPLYLLYNYTPSAWVPYYKHLWTAWDMLMRLAVGIFLGRTLAEEYRREDLFPKAMLWGALGSVPFILLQLAVGMYYIKDGYTMIRWTTWVAASAMMQALAMVIQGAVAAIPFKNTKDSYAA